MLFLTIDLCFLFSAVITKIFISISELVIPIGVPTKETKVEMETHSVTVEIKMSKGSI